MDNNKEKQINHDLQNTISKTKDLATRISLKTEGERRCFGRVRNSCSTYDTRCVTVSDMNIMLDTSIHK